MTTQHAFINRIRSLHNIDHDQLPELTDRQFFLFQYEPARYLIRADDTQAAAIWREIEKRQKPVPDASADLLAALDGVLWMAEEWFKYSCCDSTRGDEYRRELDKAEAAIAKVSSPALQATGEQS